MTNNKYIEKEWKEIPTRFMLNGFEYIINEEKMIAAINGQKTEKDLSYAFTKNILIPRSIPYNLKEYLVTSIVNNSFEGLKIKTITFAEDSELHTIGEGAFNITEIKHLTIPPSVTELREGWCSCTPKLINITIMPGNPRYKYYNDEFILGKSKIESDDYDILVFARRDIETAIIPNFIRKIDSYAFDGCKDLRSVTFQDGSQLNYFGQYVFAHSKIENIKIPPHLKKMTKNTFYFCNCLSKIEIPENSEIQIIEPDAFRFLEISEITIPACLKKLEEGWCQSTKKLNKFTILNENKFYATRDNQTILGKTSLENDIFDHLVFGCRDIKYAIIPKEVTRIEPFAFCDCESLKTVKIQQGSNLDSIGQSAFQNSLIEKMTIPSKVTIIDCFAFTATQKLQSIQFEKNSNLKIIRHHAFYCSSIKKISIPSSVTVIEKCAFQCLYLSQVIIPFDSKLEYIDDYVFSRCSINKIKIPSNVIEIRNSSFDQCSELKYVEFQGCSKLQKIGKKAFYKSSILQFSIPLNVVEIGENAFSRIITLKIIEFNENPNLKMNECHFIKNINTLLLIPISIKDKVLKNIKLYS